MGFRLERVEKIIERELASILFDAHNDVLKFVSVTKVSVTKDLAIATVWYTVLGSQTQIEATSKELVKASGFLRTELAHRVDLRKTPELRFKYDESLIYGNHISEIIEDLNNK